MIAIQPQHRFRNINEFHFLEDTQIGCGSFGVVKLARHKNTTRLYAVKVITIANIPSDTELKLFERQISIHSNIDHPQIIRLWDTLLEGDCIYMIMEYAEGGNLFYHQNTKTTFTEPQAFRFFTQTLQGVNYLHERDIIHRDLKPENLLLDCDWNIKICDLGWAAQDIHLKRTTFCGTYQYMAPEMLFKAQYDHHVDIWALGILLYELLHGHAPFKGKSVSQVQESILKGSYEVSPHLSESVRNLITNILQVPTSKRLTIKQIFNHPWVKEMENHLNAYFKLQKVTSPKDIYPRVSKIPAAPLLKFKLNTNSNQHRKNNSVTIEEMMPKSMDPAHLQSKKGKYHSQQKQNNKESVPMVSPKQVFTPAAHHHTNSHAHIIKKNKMLAAVKTQMNELEMNKSVKSKKSTKLVRQLPSFEKDFSASEINPFGESTANRKKQKNAKSQVEALAQKYPIRFHTQANEDWQPPARMKKGHGKALGYSKSGLRLAKGSKVDFRY